MDSYCCVFAYSLSETLRGCDEIENMTDLKSVGEILEGASPSSPILHMKSKQKDLEKLARKMLKTFDKLSEDYWARIDAKEWHTYFKNKLDKLLKK